MSHDIAIVIVSTNELHWLTRLLPTVQATVEDLNADVIIVDNDSVDGTAEFIAQNYPQFRVVRAPNHGFSHANNRALIEVSADYIVLLNPDTEILRGSFSDLIARMEELPDVGLAGCRQIAPDGTLWPTMRRFPNALRELAEALGSERFPNALGWLGQRELRYDRYDEEFDLDWTSGSFLLLRRAALLSAGLLDERFFIYSEEVDLARRVKDAGWRVRHLPRMEIRHHAGKKGFSPRAAAQYAWSSQFYARKHFSPPHRACFTIALLLRPLLRWAYYGLAGEPQPDAREAMRRHLLTVLLNQDPPYETPPTAALRPPPAAHQATPSRRGDS